MSQLTIRLFGSPQILLDGTPVQIAGRIPLALLAYLALTGQHHSRDTLATFFWPDARQPRTQLRNNWWLMREALGPAGAAWLHSDRDTLGFRPDDKLWLDVAHFRRATATVDAHADCAEQLCATCLAALQDAVALYRDDLLAGFALRDCPAFEEWHFFEREALRRNFAGVLETLVLHHCRQAEFAPAIHYARRRLALDTLHEPAHRWLMQLYAWSGEHAAALRQYQTCRRLLEAELHALPDPETEQLYQAIRTRTLHPPHRESPPAFATHAAKDQEAFLGSAPFATTKAAGHGQAQVQPPHNLPAPKSSLVGRKNEQAAVEAILRTPEARLITLIGPGGVGKTRLGLQVAFDLLSTFGDGCFFVPLAPIRAPELVISAIAQVLGVRETRTHSLLESVQHRLQAKQMLLILDNFEHVLAATTVVSALLAACPQLKILVTSRAVLQLYGEHEYLVAPLAHPPAPAHVETLARYAAIELFLQRARAVKPDLALDGAGLQAVASICTRLDGLPLAIELAAARVKFFPPQALLKGLMGTAANAALRFLQDGARDRPARHQTLRDAIQWSYALLTPEEQALFRKVAVFVGGFTAEAAAALDLNDDAVEPLLSHLTAVVWPDPQLVDPTVVPPVRPRPTDTPNTLATIIALVNQSLVYQETYIATDEPRFRLLETIREFGLTLLEQHGELAAVRHRHALYYLALAADAETQLNGPHYQQWLTWLEQEYNNLRAAWDWAVANRAYEVAMRLGCGLYHFWVRKGYEGEGQERMTALLPIVRNLPPSPALARYLFAVALLIDFHTGDRNRSKAIYEQSVQVCRAIGDDLKLAHPLNRLGGFAYTRGDYGMWATNLAEAQACRSKHHDWWGYALVHGHTGRELAGLGRIDEGRAACEEALALERQIGDSWGTVVTLQNFGEVTLLAGDLAEAERFLLESLALSRDLDDNYLMAIARYLLGAVALERGDLDQAERRLHGALEIMVALTNRQYTIEILAALAALALRQAQAIRALLLATVVTQQHRVDGIVLPPVKQARFDQLVARACAQLPAAVAAHTQAQGEALSPADAVALVLLADDGNRLDTGVFPSTQE